jgi:ABC-2 type transport system permease protein
MTAVTIEAVPVREANALRRFWWSTLAEWTKLRSVRSTYWTLLALFVVIVGLGVLLSWAITANWNGLSKADQTNFDSTQLTLSGLLLGQLVAIVLGAIVVTAEETSGMVRTSLSAQPHRFNYLVAKALVLTVVMLIIGWAASLAAFFLGQLFFVSVDADTTLGAHNVLRAVFGGGLFIAACGLFTFAIGVLLRHTAATIAAGTVLLFVLPVLRNFLPSSWRNDVNKWLPSTSGSQIFAVVRDPHAFSAWAGFGVFCGYIAVLLLAGIVLFVRRDT